LAPREATALIEMDGERVDVGVMVLDADAVKDAVTLDVAVILTVTDLVPLEVVDEVILLVGVCDKLVD